MFFYYCPNCSYESEIRQVPRDSVGNCRDGFGTPINHFECPKCGNLDAGAMRINEESEIEGWKRYCRHVIGMYQGVRGFSRK